MALWEKKFNKIKHRINEDLGIKPMTWKAFPPPLIKPSESITLSKFCRCDVTKVQI